MILIQRRPSPSIFESAISNKLNSDLYEFYNLDPTIRSQKRFKFDSEFLSHDSIKESLAIASHSKCYYCEAILLVEEYTVDHFRPINGSLGIFKDDFSPDHYWWLTYDWENLNLSCSACNQSKGNRFPVSGKRVEILGSESKLQLEDLLLLDPTGKEDPWKHLEFTEDGRILGLTKKGGMSIDVFGLNRSSLVKRRSNELQALHRQVCNVINQSKPDLDALFIGYTSNKEEFVQMKRQILNKWIAKPHRYLQLNYILNSDFNIPKFRSNLVERLEFSKVYLPPHGFRKVPVKSTGKSLSIKTEIEAETEAEAIEYQYSYLTFLIDRVEIKNFKSIERMEIDFASKSSDKASWKMFLGENGVGKTSILQAIALALAGKKNVKDLRLSSKKFLRKNNPDLNSEIKVYFVGHEVPLTLTISKFGFHFQTNKKIELVLLAYGATRLMGKSEDSTVNKVAVKNLFNNNERLHGVTKWMLEINVQQFDQVARALKDILALDDEGTFIRSEKGIFFLENKHEYSFDQMSDGYQSLIALSGHLMKSLLRDWPSLDVAEGIVLIDEIGLHMHPVWKMRIVSSLRQAFPRVQFICTTHDPLCLKGLLDKEVEVIVKRKIDNVVFNRTKLPPIEGLRVDQILLSEHFGLNTTLDFQTEKAYQEYYELLRSRSSESKDLLRLEELTKFLNSHTTLGSSRREILALRYIDEYIADTKINLSEEHTFELSEETKEKVKNILGANVKI